MNCPTCHRPGYIDPAEQERIAEVRQRSEALRDRAAYEAVARAAAAEWMVPVADVLDRNTAPSSTASVAKAATYWILRRRGWGWSRIGRAADRNHATIITTARRFQARIVAEPELRARVGRTIENANGALRSAA